MAPGMAFNHQATGGAALHPSTSRTTRRESDQVWLTQAWVLNDRSLNQVKAGLSNFDWSLLPDAKWQGGAFPNAKGLGGGGSGNGTRPPSLLRSFGGHSYA